MQLAVVTDHRFLRTRDGLILSRDRYGYEHWGDARESFADILIVARVRRGSRHAGTPVEGEGVHFFDLGDPPRLIGIARFLLALPQLAWILLTRLDAIFLRVPGVMSTLLWPLILLSRRPYGVEVVGDAATALTLGSSSWRHALVRRPIHICTRLQVQRAAVASYVSSHLQRQYPCRNSGVIVPGVRLPDAAFASPEALAVRTERLADVSHGLTPLRLAFVGSLQQRYKGLDVVLSAAQLLPQASIDVHLTVVGDGRYRASYEDMVKEFGLASLVHFTGHLVGPDCVREEVLSKSDMFILPSRSEGMPRALLEAMAQGLPCIATPVGGIPEVLPASCQVPIDDPEAIVRVVAAMLASPSLTHQTVALGLKTVEGLRLENLQRSRRQVYALLQHATSHPDRGGRS